MFSLWCCLFLLQTVLSIIFSPQCADCLSWHLKTEKDILPFHAPSKFVICGKGSTSWPCRAEALVSSAHLLTVFWDETYIEMCISIHITYGQSTCTARKASLPVIMEMEKKMENYNETFLYKNVIKPRINPDQIQAPIKVVDVPCLSVFRRHLDNALSTML